ncbi:MAG: lipopolysaccharide assembly protein LapA domain-containing protein [Pseudomonadota bacterium]
MQFLKAIFQAFIVVVAAIFAYNNWIPVTVNLWGGIVLDTVLPLLLLVAFLMGLLPALLLYRTTRWRLRRKLDSTEKALASVQSASDTPVSTMIPPTAAPMAVPPGVS